MPAPTRANRDAHAPGAINPQTPATRDLALRRLARAKRWLLAGTATLTGVLTAVAASAFPGKSVKSATGTTREASASPAGAGQAGTGQSASETSPLQRPEGEPQASAPAESQAPSTPAPEAPVVSGGS